MADTATVIIVPRVPPGGEVASTITLSASSYTADENTVASFTVNRVNGFGNSVSVDWTITGVAAATVTSGTVTFALGVGVEVVNVPLGEVTADEVGILTLSNVVNVTGEVDPVLGLPFSASFTAVDVPVIVDIDLSLSSASYSGLEQTIITFYINRIGAVGATSVSVDYTLAGVTASPLADTVVFAESDTQISVDIAAGDITSNESGTLTLSNPQNLSGDGNTVGLEAPSSASFDITTTIAVNEFNTYRFQVLGSTGLSTETDKNTHFPIIRFTHTSSAKTLDLLLYYKGTDTWEVNFGAWLPSGTSAVGAWTWSMTSGDAGLQNHANATGSLTVVTSSHRGALLPHPTKKKFYFVGSGVPFIPYELRTVFFASDVSTANFTIAADFMQANNIPGIETQLTVENNNFGWGGNRNDWIFSDKNNTIFDQTVWDRMQDRMDILNARELGAHVMFYSDDFGSPLTNLNYSETQAHTTIPKYVAARLAGYPYLMWNGMIDATEVFEETGPYPLSEAFWNTWESNVSASDPYGHPISNRAGGGVAPITNETYASQIDPQQARLTSSPNMQVEYDGNSIVTGWDDAWGINRPSHNSKNHNNDDSYIMLWKALVAGGGHFLTRPGDTSIGGGHSPLTIANTAYDLANLEANISGDSGSVFADTSKHFQDFFDTYLGADFLNMQRDDSYTAGTANFACAEAGNKVVILAARGNLRWDTGGGATCTLDLTGETGTWSVTKYNILTGEATALATLDGGISRPETLDSTTQSWVYFLSAEVVPSWNNTFTNLPDPQQGIYYKEDLTDYGVNVEEVHEIGTSRSLNNGESIWPEGLTLNTSTGILSGYPTTQSDVAVVEVIGVNGTFDATADWNFRSGLSDVNTVVSQDFSASTDVTDVTDAWASGNTDRVVWDSSTKLFSNGAMRLDTLSTDVYPGDRAAWVTAIIAPGAEASQNDATPLAVGEELWICYSMRNNRAEVDYIPNIVGLTVKHTAKIALIDEGSGAGAGADQIALQYTWGHMVQGGTGPNAQNGVSTACDPTDIRYGNIDLGANPLSGVDPGLPTGNGAGLPWTQCQQDRARYGLLYSWWNGTTNPDDEGVSDPLAPGATPFNWWYSIMHHIKRNVDGTSTLVECWYAPLGQDWSIVYSKTFAGFSYDWCRMQLTNSNGGGASNGIINEPGRPTYNRWYDGIITRKGSTRIPAPGFTS